MSAPDRNQAPQSSVPTSKLQQHDEKNKIDPTTGASVAANPNQPAMLEEDDEFEDFPVEDWPAEETTDPSSTAPGTTAAAASATTHLWEESWDDDEDGNEEFSKALKEELKKVEGAK